MRHNKTWYAITDNRSESVTVEIHDYIGEGGITARDFVQDLKTIDASKIDLHINSPGGSVIDGVAIQNALKQHPAMVTTYIDGIAGSIASIIALAGEQIFIADNAYVMIHNPTSGVWGDATQMKKESEVLDKMAKSMAADYAQKMNITVEAASALMDSETWYLGQEAVDAGYADAVFQGAAAVASFDPNRFTAKAPAEVMRRFTSSPQSGNPSQSANLKEKTMPDETTATSDETTVVNEVADSVESVETETEVESVSVEQAVQTALANDRKRISLISKIGDDFNFTADAKKFIASGKSVDEFRAYLLDKSPDDFRASLSVRNPSMLQTECEEKTDTVDAVALVRERRKSRYGI